MKLVKLKLGQCANHSRIVVLSIKERRKGGWRALFELNFWAFAALEEREDAFLRSILRVENHVLNAQEKPSSNPIPPGAQSGRLNEIPNVSQR